VARASLSPVGANVVGARVGGLVSPRLVGAGVGAARAKYASVRCRSRTLNSRAGATHMRYTDCYDRSKTSFPHRTVRYTAVEHL
jgi:hypothetical protein